MTRPNFASMSTAELRAYVLQHREDNEAFHELADRVSQTGVTIQSSEQLTQLIAARQKVQQDRSEQ